MNTNLIEALVMQRQTRILAEYPPAVRWLNYPGDRRGVIGTIVGPNLMGEYLTIVDAAYDAEQDKTRAGLAYGVIRLGEGGAMA